MATMPVWSFDASGNGDWRAASRVDTETLEACFLSRPVKPTTLHLGSQGFKYDVDMAAMTQTNLESGVVRSLRRVEASLPFWIFDASGNGDWRAASRVDTETLEACFLSGPVKPTTLPLGSHGSKYDVDMAAMTQTNLESGVVRSLRRVVASLPFWIFDASGNGDWRAASRVDTETLEACFLSGPVKPITLPLGSQGFKYDVDMAAMTQTNLESGVVRSLRRVCGVTWMCAHSDGWRAKNHADAAKLEACLASGPAKPVVLSLYSGMDKQPEEYKVDLEAMTQTSIASSFTWCLLRKEMQCTKMDQDQHAVAGAKMASVETAIQASAKGLWSFIGEQELSRIAAGLVWKRAHCCEIADPRMTTAISQYIQDHWAKTTTPNRTLKRIELLSVPNMETCIQCIFQTANNYRSLAGSPLNPANLGTPDFKEGLDKLRENFLTLPETGSKANIVLTWHGTDYNVRYSVVSGGLQPLRTTDGGYFGAGSYTTLNASYAAEYAEMKSSGPNHEYAVLLVATCVGCAYVVTRARDYADQISPDARSRFFGPTPESSVAIMPGYDTHFVPVKHPKNQACKVSDATSFEVVSRDPGQCCPLAICYYTK